MPKNISAFKDIQSTSLGTSAQDTAATTDTASSSTQTDQKSL
jgi:hypothetical protein